ncbi:MAG: hypothetical protein JXR91_01400 [Deltaproteobacteria bacterium]|nr:hypothetical protein [Deltaproteobacteria bacterium]
MNTYLNQPINKLISDFLNEIQKETGVDDIFLAKMRPSVKKMFLSSSEDKIGEKKDVLMKKAKFRVESQKSLQDTLEHLNNLSNNAPYPNMLTIEERQRISFTTALVINTMLKTYGGFGTTIKILS